MKRFFIFGCLWTGALLGQQPAPELSISANGSHDVDLYQGWPLIVRATIQNSQRFSGSPNPLPLVIAQNGLSWTDAIQFTVVSSSGQMSQWNLTLVGLPSDPGLTLQPRSYVTATWQMSGDAVAALSPDTYQLSASLVASNSSGWNGSVQSTPINIRVTAEPSPLTADLEADKAMLVAEYAVNNGDADSALSAMQALLTDQPGQPMAMLGAANILELKGYYTLAFFQASDGLQTYYESNPPLPEAPTNALTMQQRLFTILATPDATTPVVSQVGALDSSGNLTPATPGATFSILGQNLGLTAASSAATPLPMVLGSTIVTVNDTPVALSSVSPTRIDAQMPADLQPGNLNVVVFSGDSASDPFSATVQPSMRAKQLR